MNWIVPDDIDVPDDERRSMSTTTTLQETTLVPAGEDRSVATYAPKESNNNKRTAQKDAAMVSFRESPQLLVGTTSVLPPGEDKRFLDTVPNVRDPLSRTTSCLPSNRPQRQQQPPIARPPPGFESTANSSSRFADSSEREPVGLYGRDLLDGNNLSEIFVTSLSILSKTDLSSVTPDPFFPNTIPAASNVSSMGHDETNDQKHRVHRRLSPTADRSRIGNPRSILNERYQRKYGRPFTKKNFLSIRDARDGDHLPTFTSIFVCPETQESFVSGDMLQADLVVRRDGLNWYRKKTTAEFAAAGRAEDSFLVRSGESLSNERTFFCGDTPRPNNNRKEEVHDLASFSESCRQNDLRTYQAIESLLRDRRVTVEDD